MEFEKLQGIIAEVLNLEPEEVTMEATFVDDLGADSLDVFQIIMGIEEEFDIEIPNETAEKIVTVGDAVEAIRNATELTNEMKGGSRSMSGPPSFTYVLMYVLRKEEMF